MFVLRASYTWRYLGLISFVLFSILSVRIISIRILSTTHVINL